MPSLLLTGANRGIGLELARAFADDDWTVIATARRPEEATALFAIDGDVTVTALDVADPASVAILGERMAGIPLDLVINAAGVYGPRNRQIGETDFGAWTNVLATNTLGPVRVAEAFLPHLRDGEQKKIVTLSSQMGSIARNNSGGNLIYRSSKAAVNAAMRSIAMDLAAEAFTVVVVHPGWVQTDMGGPNATLGPAASAAALKALIDRLSPECNGRFLNHDGTEIPW